MRRRREECGIQPDEAFSCLNDVLRRAHPAKARAGQPTVGTDPREGPSMATWLGAKEVAFLLAQAPELPAPPVDWEAQARRKIFYDPVDGADLRAYIQKASYGKARLLGDVYGPFQVVAKRPDGSWDIGGAMDQAVAAATAGGALAGVTNFCVVFTDHPGPSWAFWGSGGRCYVDMLVPMGVMAMENLHVLTQFPDLYGIADSPGGYDVMDCSCGTHPSAFTKLDFGWLDAAEIATVAPASGSTSLSVHALSEPLSTAPTPGRVHAIKLPAPGASAYHLIEARLRTDRYESPTPDVSSGIPHEGVVVYWIDSSTWPPVHLKSVLQVAGDTYTDATHGVTVTLSATVSAGFTVLVDRTPPSECAWIRDELASVLSDIKDWQADLQDASPGQKAGIIAQIKRLQAQAAKLRARAQQVGCPT